MARNGAGAAARAAAMAILVATVASPLSAQHEDVAPRRDLLLAAASPTAPGEFEVRLWSSWRGVDRFDPRQVLAQGDGRVTHIDRADEFDGDYFVSADLYPLGRAGSAITGHVSPFTRMHRVNHLPTRVHYAVRAPERIADFEYDPPDPSDPVRSDTLVVVGLDTATGANWVRRVRRNGGLVQSAVFGSGAQALALAIEPGTGDVHVADDRGVLVTLTAAFAVATFNLITPAIACSDLHWRTAAGGRGALLATARGLGVAADATFLLTPGPAPTAQPLALLPAAASGLTCDAGGDGFILLAGTAGGLEVWHWPGAGAVIRPTNLPRANWHALAWTSRTTLELIAAAPGTPIAVDMSTLRVGDPGLEFRVSAAATAALVPMGTLFSDGFTDASFGLGPRAQLIADPTSRAFVFHANVLRRPGSMFVPMPLGLGHDGVRAVAQLLFYDPITQEWVTSWAANFVVGR